MMPECDWEDVLKALIARVLAYTLAGSQHPSESPFDRVTYLATKAYPLNAWIRDAAEKIDQFGGQMAQEGASAAGKCDLCAKTPKGGR